MKSIPHCLRAAALAVLALSASGAMAQAYRVQNWTWAGYYAGVNLETVNANGVFHATNTNWFLSDYQYNIGGTGTGLPSALTYNATSSGNPVLSPSTVSISSLADTSFGQNHASVQVSGFDPYSIAPTTTTQCTTIDGVNCVPGLPTQTQTLSSSNRAYGQAQSQWEDIYQTGGSSGALTFTFQAHANLASQPSGSGAASGSASLWWAETDFNGQYLAYISASYSAETDEWGLTTFSNVSGYRYFSGNGSLSFGAGAVATSWDGTTFDGTVTVQRDYATGDVVYASSLLQTSVGGNGISDAANTVTLTNIALPTGGRILALSGANYSGIVTGGGNGGGLCTTASCLGGGGGGNPPPVPEPETYAMMLAGLAALGWLRLRRGRA